MKGPTSKAIERGVLVVWDGHERPRDMYPKRCTLLVMPREIPAHIMQMPAFRAYHLQEDTLGIARMAADGLEVEAKMKAAAETATRRALYDKLRLEFEQADDTQEEAE